MTTETSKIPNELLVRWTDTGVLSGAHVKYLEILKVDGVAVMARVGDAIPISAAGDFPFQKFLPDIQAGAIASAERAWAEAEAAKEQARKDVDEAMMKKGEAENELALAVRVIAKLQDELKAAKAPKKPEATD
jgi:hypothetical protein